MKVVFEQKRGLNYRRHTLYDEKILVETKSLKSIDRYEIKLDQLGFDIRYHSDNVFAGKVFLVISLAIPLLLTASEVIFQNVGMRALLFNFLVWWGLAALNYFKQHNDDIYLTGGEKNLVFYRNIPSEKKVLEFINLINKATKDFLKIKYLNPDESFPGEFLSHLYWMKDKQIISQAEFDKLKNDFEVKRLLN